MGFLLLGPFSCLAGARSLGFGGKRGSATVAGMIGEAGCLASWLSGDTVARITVASGWKNAFLSLAGVALFTALVLVIHRRMPNPAAVEAQVCKIRLGVFQSDY